MPRSPAGVTGNHQCVFRASKLRKTQMPVLDNWKRLAGSLPKADSRYLSVLDQCISDLPSGQKDNDEHFASLSTTVSSFAHCGFVTCPATQAWTCGRSGAFGSNHYTAFQQIRLRPPFIR